MKSCIACLTITCLAIVMATRPSANEPQSRAEAAPQACPQAAIHGSGLVEPLTGVRHLSFAAGGVIQSCRVKVGDFVARGTPLMELQRKDRQARLNLAREKLELAKADRARTLAGVNKSRIAMARQQSQAARHTLEYHQSRYEKYRELFQSSAVSKNELELSRRDLDVARAALRELEKNVEYLETMVTPEDADLTKKRTAVAAAGVKVAEASLDKSILRAPFDGHILDILRREGESVDEISRPPVLVFGDTSRRRIRAEVDERYVLRLSEGIPVTISGRNLHGRSYRGTISSISQQMGRKTLFAGKSTERRGLEVAEVMIRMDEDFSAPVGLLVDVRIETPRPTR